MVDDRLGGEDFVVRHRLHDAVRRRHRAHGTFPRCRIPNANRRRARLGAHADARREVLLICLREWRGASGLHGQESGNAVDQPETMRLVERLSERRRVAEIPRWQRDPVGRVPRKLLEHLEDDRLLSLDAERIHRVHEVDAELFAGVAREPEAVVEVAADLQRARPIGYGLRQLSRRHTPFRNEHERRNARLGRVGAERCRRVARRGTGNGARANASCLCHRHGHPAILERATRVVALVLHQEVVHPGVRVHGGAMQQRRVALGVAHDLVARRIQHDLAKAPDAGAVQRARRVHRPRRPFVEHDAQRAPLNRRGMFHRQQPVTAIAHGLCGPRARFGAAVRTANDHGPGGTGGYSNG